MNELKQISKSKCFEGDQLVFSHYSDVCNCDMTFALYLPSQTNDEKLQVIWFLSGLTCTHENAMIKSGIQRWASEEKIAIIFPDLESIFFTSFLKLILHFLFKNFFNLGMSLSSKITCSFVLIAP